MEHTVWKGSFEDAAEREVIEYANSTWKESVVIAESLRKMIWADSYKMEPIWTVRIAKLKEDRDDFE